MAGNANSGGQNAKTVKHLQDTGGFREDRHGGIHNMKHVPGRPETPKDLKGDALEEWNRMMTRMELAGSLTKIDDAAVYQYSKLYAETLKAERHQDKLVTLIDKMVETSNRLDGAELVMSMQHIANLEKTLSQYRNTVRNGRMAIRQYLVEFGMTSSARGRVKMPGQSERPAGRLMSFRGGKSE